MIPEAAHNANMDDAAAFNRALAAFLRQPDPKSRVS